jgi:hypothetical protein
MLVDRSLLALEAPRWSYSIKLVRVSLFSSSEMFSYIVPLHGSPGPRLLCSCPLRTWGQPLSGHTELQTWAHCGKLGSFSCFLVTCCPQEIPPHSYLGACWMPCRSLTLYPSCVHDCFPLGVASVRAVSACPVPMTLGIEWVCASVEGWNELRHVASGGTVNSNSGDFGLEESTDLLTCCE